MRKQLYSKAMPHFCRAIVCFDAFQFENAVSWMERDLGEAGCGVKDMPDPTTLKLCENGLEYITIGERDENTAGAGI